MDNFVNSIKNPGLEKEAFTYVGIIDDHSLCFLFQKLF